MRTLDTTAEEGLNAAVTRNCVAWLVTGRMSPGFELSTRGLAQELGVSQTPVRDALSRLAAEGAVAIRSKRRVLVPPMTESRFDDLLRCRMLLEPEAAALALPHIDDDRLTRLREIDAALDQAIANGDTEAYMARNHAFHFTIYSAQDGRTLTQLIETLWLQFGPFMRTVHGRIQVAHLNDNHQAAIAAIATARSARFAGAIAADIADGMGLIASSGVAAQRRAR
ncbi:MAG: GntR family transcriptional regulator [Hyphomonadaceae bacterium]